MVSTAILGASGFLGAELMRLCAGHPDLNVELVTGDSQAGTAVGSLYPSLAAAYAGVHFATYDPDTLDGLDLAFCALPHGASQALMPELRTRVKHVIDLAADFRLRDASLYPRWYGEAHQNPDLLGEAVYGLPETTRDALRSATLVAAAGCYPTTATLALKPLLDAGLVERTGIIVDAASGVSGAGRDKFPFCGTDEDFTAYGLLDHRHTPEIEQNLDAQVLFTPHLAPMNRGILATCYARPAASTSTDEVMDVLRRAYDDEPFVVVTDRPPSTKATLGSNTAHVTARVDERTGWVLSLCAIDNLVKGGSGQGIQCANLALGLDETAGLPIAGVYP
jgi:N-acetyl-gamma-glutamyl-phosphate reductase